MTETVKIGELEIAMRADGATPFLFKQAFDKDLIKIIANASEEKDFSEAGSIASELGFVMAQQAASPDPLHVDLSHGAFMKWLTQFGPLDLIYQSMDIIEVYMGTQKTDSVAKKKDESQIES